jgi:hypothetical protein
MKKTLIAMLAASSMLLSAVPMGHVQAASLSFLENDPQVSIYLDGLRLKTEPAPILYNGRTMVPFRAVAEALGLQVQWDAETESVLAGTTELDIKMQVGNRLATAQGKNITLDAEPILYENRVMIPLRFISESVGANVGWDQVAKRVTITSQQRDLHTMVYYGLGSYSKKGYLPKFDETTFTWSRLDSSGRLAFGESEYRWPQEGAPELIEEVKAAGTETSLMVFSVDEKGELTKLLNDANLQQEFIETLISKLVKWNIDGATLDFETLGDPFLDDVKRVKDQYTAFVTKVAKALHAQNKKLTVVMGTPNGWYQGYDYAAISKQADSLFIMAYSYISDREPQPLDKIEEAARMAAALADPKKLILGINAVSETNSTVKEKIGVAKRYNLGGVGFWILVAFDDGFMKAIDDTLLLKGE